MIDNNTINIGRKAASGYDDGLRQYFLKIYSLMSAALGITCISAFVVFSIPFLSNLLFITSANGSLIGITGLCWIVNLAPIAISLYFTFSFSKISAQNAKILLWVYAILIGMSLSSLGFVYTGVPIAKTFLICFSIFAGMSIYGYTTKKDLSSFGSFLYMRLLGLILASVDNIFFKSSNLELILSSIGVLIFTGLIFYDTQKLKDIYYNNNRNEKISIMASFILYLDFINPFLFFKRCIGARRGDD